MRVSHRRWKIDGPQVTPDLMTSTSDSGAYSGIRHRAASGRAAVVQPIRHRQFHIDGRTQRATVCAIYFAADFSHGHVLLRICQ